MPIALPATREASPRYAIFGKLPRRADFVRVGTDHSAATEFSELLGKSLALAGSQPDWRVRAAADASDFQMTSRDGRWRLAGVLMPSHDEAGRIYPLVAGVVLPAQAGAACAPEFIIANELFFSGLAEQLASAVENAVDLIACRQFFETWIAPNPHASDDIALAAQILARHMDETLASNWRTVLAGADAGDIDDWLLPFLFHARAPRARCAPILLPLSEAPGEDRLDEAAWLALLCTAMGNGRTPDFITVKRGEKRHLAVPPGRLDEKFLAAALWGATTGTPGAGGEALRQPPERAAIAFDLARQLQDPALTLASLQTVLERLAHELATGATPQNTLPFPFTD
ncbi:MAG: type VI secretion system-associated protein TagF [Azoarcus sp.]|jgi:type VI secretion system protein ImpM|nr:type VI secretion system-associated protein TagF [Azoarcus sp.]